jgi:hypothetical protein
MTRCVVCEERKAVERATRFTCGRPACLLALSRLVKDDDGALLKIASGIVR